MERLILCAVALLLSALCSCDHSRKELAGKWKSGEVIWEFSSNGSLTTNGTSGRYTLGDNDRLKIQTGAATFVYQMEISGDRMIWKDPAGSAMELTRLR